MSQKNVPPPSIKLTSFACPICGAHSNQTWFNTFLDELPRGSPTPNIKNEMEIIDMEINLSTSGDKASREIIGNIINNFRQMLNEEPFLRSTKDHLYNPINLENIFVSWCYTCKRPSIWLHDKLLYPGTFNAPPPNSDLSDSVKRDYEEARKVLNTSPRSSCALLRLSIEKLLIELSIKGKDINEQIKNLVDRGLPAQIQQALDTLRVIGNHAVHPGTLDLRDDKETATKLFNLVNFVASELITRPREVASLYEMIPEKTRNAIEDRDKK